MSYIRTFKNGNSGTSVQVCTKEHGKVVKTIHIGTASTKRGIIHLKKQAQKVIDADKSPLFDLASFDIKNEKLQGQTKSK